jgi:hypothetical protein
MKKKFLLVLLIFLSALIASYSQVLENSEHSYRFGLFNEFNSITNYSGMNSFPNIAVAEPVFSTSVGTGYSFGADYSYFFNKNIGLNIRAGLKSSSGNFKSLVEVIVGPDDQPLSLIFEHNLAFSLQDLNLEAGFTYLFYDRLNLTAGLGMSYYYNSLFNLDESIVFPSGNFQLGDTTVVANQKLIIQNNTGQIPDLNKFQFYLTLKAGYDIPLSEDYSYIFRPEAGWDFCLSNMSSSLAWKTMGVKLGFSLLFSTGPKPIASTNSKSIKELNEARARLNDLEKKLDQSVEENKNLKIENEKIKSDADKALEKAKNEMLDQEQADSLLKNKDISMMSELEKEKLDREKIEQERQEMNRMIDEENKKTGKSCSCFVLLFTTTPNKEEADNLVNSLKSNSINEVTTSVFVDPYLNEKHYRVQSQCFSDHNDAFDLRLKILHVTNTLNIIPQIKCNK